MAEDSQAQSGLEAAVSRQNALPGYVEHVFARMPEMPGGTETITHMVMDQVKDQALEKLQQKIDQTTAHVPAVGEEVDRSLDELGNQLDQPYVVKMGPEREIATIEHSGGRVRQVFADGMGEMVRANGRVAVRINVQQQIAALQVMAAANATRNVVKDAANLRATIASISKALAQGATGDIVGAVMVGLNEIGQLANDARTSAELIRATVALEKLSGVWQCRLEGNEGQHPKKVIEVQQLPDEALGDVTAHAYRSVFETGTDSAMPARTTDDEPSRPVFQMQVRNWIRASDGLPLRSQFAVPGGSGQRTDFEYRAVAEIPLPECMTQP